MTEWRLIPAAEAADAQRAALAAFQHVLADSLARPLDRYDANRWWPLAAKPPAPTADDPTRTVAERSRWVHELYGR